MEFRLKRFLEMVPGLITWGFIITIVILSYFTPVFVSYVIVFYSIYFIYQSVSVVALMMTTSRRTQKALKTNWYEVLEHVKTTKNIFWHELYHAVIIPYANEGSDVLRPTLQCLADNIYPANKKIVVLATEKKYPQGQILAQELQEEFAHAFSDIIITVHELKSDEIVGKASNENWAARQLYTYAKDHHINTNKVIVTSMDSDGRQPQYFMSRLTYVYINEKEPQKRIYQPIPMFFNNLWEVPFIARIIATFSAQWQMALALKPHRFMNFSCYAICLETLHVIGYWDPDIIPEDERIFWKAVKHYGQELKVVSLFMPIYLDAVKASTYMKSLKEQYIQIRRWAWGASEVAYSVPSLWKNKDIPFSIKVLYISQQLRKSFEWALAPFILLFGLSLPSHLNPAFSQNILSYSLPTILSKVLTFSTGLMIAVFYIEAVFAPPQPTQWSIMRKGFSLAQWITFPFVSILFSAVPAIEAQTRLIIGKPIQYKATEKSQH